MSSPSGGRLWWCSLISAEGGPDHPEPLKHTQPRLSDPSELVGASCVVGLLRWRTPRFSPGWARRRCTVRGRCMEPPPRVSVHFHWVRFNFPPPPSHSGHPADGWSLACKQHVGLCKDANAWSSLTCKNSKSRLSLVQPDRNRSPFVKSLPCSQSSRTLCLCLYIAISVFSCV